MPQTIYLADLRTPVIMGKESIGKAHRCSLKVDKEATGIVAYVSQTFTLHVGAARARTPASSSPPHTHSPLSFNLYASSCHQTMEGLFPFVYFTTYLYANEISDHRVNSYSVSNVRQVQSTFMYIASYDDAAEPFNCENL